jgi:UDP-glucose 4-epimerase
MKALITGVSGRVGANVAAKLQERGYHVRGVVFPGDPKTQKVHDLGVEVMEAEMNDTEAVYRAVDGMDTIVHLAAQMKQGNSTVQRMVEINTMGTLNVLEGVLRSSVTPSSIVFASTDQAYHPFVTEKTTFYEEHHQQPIDIYAVTKLMSEDLCLTYLREYDLPIKRMRYSSVLAADEALQILTPAWLDSYVNSEWQMPKRVPWFGTDKIAAAKAAVAKALETPNGVCGIMDDKGVSWAVPFTDVRDTVDGTLRVIDSPDAIGDVFNLVGPSSTPFVAAAKLIAQHTDRPYVEVKMPFLWWFGVANNKARAVLGYAPKYDFPDMVEGALAFRSGKDIGVVPV